jgi:hypothetical protein
MAGTTAHPRELAEHHAKEAERLLGSWWLSTHVKAQVHATLAVYYAEQAERVEKLSGETAGCHDR